MGATVHLIERLEPRLGRSRFRWARRSVIDPLLPLAAVRFAAPELRGSTNPRSSLAFQDHTRSNRIEPRRKDRSLVE
jgi:hypothetical protein